MQKPHTLFLGLLALLIVAVMFIPGMSAFSLWYDEVQVFRASDELHRLADFYRLEGFPVRITHPPLFFALLKGWMTLTGQTDIALRALTTLGGLLTAALIYRVTTDLARSPTGGFAAAVIFGNLGFVVYYLHQTHNYSLLLIETAMLLFFYQRWQSHTRLRYAVGLVASQVLVLYTHYFSIYLLLAFNLYTLVRHHVRLRQWLALQAITALCYVPWLPTLYRVMVAGVYRQTEAAATVATSIPPSWTALAAIWEALLYDGWGYYTICLGVGMVASLIRPARPRRRALDAIGLLFTAGLGSLLLAMLSNTVWQTLSARRIIYLLVFLSVWMGYGLAYLPSPWRWAALTALVVMTPNNNFPVYLPGNWFFRETLTYIAQNARPEDAVYINISGKLDEEPFRHYATHLLPANVPFHAQSDDPIDRLYTYLPRERIWVIWKPNGTEPVTWWNSALQSKNFTETHRQAVAFWRVSLFTASDDRPAVPLAYDNPETLVLPQTFDDQIELVRCEVDKLEASPGDWLTLHLDWRAKHRLEREWTIFVHLIADDLTTLYSQADRVPTYLGERLPTIAWPVDAIIYDQLSLQVNPNTPPGAYNLRVGFYSQEFGVRMHAVPGDGTDVHDGVIIAKIRVGQ